MRNVSVLGTRGREAGRTALVTVGKGATGLGKERKTLLTRGRSPRAKRGREKGQGGEKRSTARFGKGNRGGGIGGKKKARHSRQKGVLAGKGRVGTSGGKKGQRPFHQRRKRAASQDEGYR